MTVALGYIFLGTAFLLILFLCVFCFLIGRPDGVDIALLYALMNFIATIAVLKFFNYKALNVGLMDVKQPQTKDLEAKQ